MWRHESFLLDSRWLSVILVPMAAVSPYHGPVQKTEFPGTPRHTLVLPPPLTLTQSSLSLEREMQMCHLGWPLDGHLLSALCPAVNLHISCCPLQNKPSWLGLKAALIYGHTHTSIQESAWQHVQLVKCHSPFCTPSPHHPVASPDSGGVGSRSNEKAVAAPRQPWCYCTCREAFPDMLVR